MKDLGSQSSSVVAQNERRVIFSSQVNTILTRLLVFVIFQLTESCSWWILGTASLRCIIPRLVWTLYKCIPSARYFTNHEYPLIIPLLKSVCRCGCSFCFTETSCSILRKTKIDYQLLPTSERESEPGALSFTLTLYFRPMRIRDLVEQAGRDLGKTKTAFSEFTLI